MARSNTNTVAMLRAAEVAGRRAHAQLGISASRLFHRADELPTEAAELLRAITLRVADLVGVHIDKSTTPTVADEEPLRNVLVDLDARLDQLFPGIHDTITHELQVLEDAADRVWRGQTDADTSSSHEECNEEWDEDPWIVPGASHESEG